MCGLTWVDKVLYDQSVVDLVALIVAEQKLRNAQTKETWVKDLLIVFVELVISMWEVCGSVVVVGQLFTRKRSTSTPWSALWPTLEGWNQISSSYQIWPAIIFSELANAQFISAKDQTKILSEEFSFEVHFLSYITLQNCETINWPLFVRLSRISTVWCLKNIQTAYFLIGSSSFETCLRSSCSNEFAAAAGCWWTFQTLEHSPRYIYVEFIHHLPTCKIQLQ